MELNHIKKSDIFTPDNISEKMASYLYPYGELLEPSVGDGQLLKFIEYANYDKIDIYDIKKEYLERCDNHTKMTKFNEDFLIKDLVGSKYKNIILNPPYIKIQDLPVSYRDFIRKKYPILNGGNIDIYYAFILKCIDLLDNDGIMVCITPNSYLYNKSALKLRKYLIENRFISEIIDYKSEKIFDKVSTYCCITVFTKKNKDTFIYHDNTNNEQIIKSYKDIINSEYSIFNSQRNSGVTLNDICIFKNGIATLRDKIYIHKNKLFDEPCWKPASSCDRDSWCIFPYDNAVIIGEEKFREDNPHTYSYLEEHRDELAKRDKGNKKYPKWYSYGRTQSLKISKSPKVLYIPTFLDPNNFIYKIKKPCINIGTISIDIKEGKNYTPEYIQQIIEKNEDFITQNSSKRGGGWINISSRILKQIVVD